MLSCMVREISKIEKKNNGLTEEKDYLTEAWLQGGKAIGELVKGKKKEK